MNTRYRLGLVILGATFVLLALSILIVPPDIPRHAVTDQVFSSLFWGVVFGVLGAVLIASAVADHVRLVGWSLAGLFGVTAAYAFAAWVIVLADHTGWQIASRVTGLATAEGLLMFAGPVKRDSPADSGNPGPAARAPARARE